MRVLVLDTETSGLPKTKIINFETLCLWPHVVQFSYVIFENDLLKVVDNIVKVPANVEITEENSNIHGITKNITQTKGKCIIEIIEEFMNDFNDVDLIVAHNIEFDLNMIKVEIMRIIKQKSNNTMYNIYLEKIILTKKIFCTLKETTNFCELKIKRKNGSEYNKFPKLSELHNKLFGIIPNNLHNSLNDVLITLRCFYKFKYDLDLIVTNKKIEKMMKHIVISY